MSRRYRQIALQLYTKYPELSSDIWKRIIQEVKREEEIIYSYNKINKHSYYNYKLRIIFVLWAEHYDCTSGSRNIFEHNIYYINYKEIEYIKWFKSNYGSSSDEESDESYGSDYTDYGHPDDHVYKNILDYKGKPIDRYKVYGGLFGHSLRYEDSSDSSSDSSSEEE